MTNWPHDLRHAVRSLRRSPGFTAVAVFTLALGIGASTAIYTLIEHTLLRPLPYPESERLVKLKSPVPGVGAEEEWQLSEGEYFYFAKQAKTIEEIGAYRRSGANVRTPGGAQRIHTGIVTASMLRLIGASPVLGRVIDERDDDPDAPGVAVLSHGFWQGHFGADPGVIGRTLVINEKPVEVVGVMAPGVELPGERGAAQLAGADIWLPYSLNPEGPFYNSHVIPVIARLAPGATLDQAQAELDRLTARLPEALPQVYNSNFMEKYGFGTRAYRLKEYVVGEIDDYLWILLAAVGIVLVIAGSNVANLLLVRAEGRRRELAIRAALGAGRGAIARYLLAESLVIAVAGGTVGILIAMWSVGLLTSVGSDSIPRLDHLQVDGGSLLFALSLSVAVAGMLSLAPILRYRTLAGSGALSEDGRSTTAGRERQRARSMLVIVQVAMALVLVVGAGLFLESIRRLRAVDPGVNASGVLTMKAYLPNARYPEMAQQWRFYDEVLERIRALPGVSAAGVSTVLPFSGGYGCTVQGFEDAAVMERLGGAEAVTCAAQEPTSPGYLEALGIPVLRGRTLTDADNDHPTTGAVVVSQAFAERFWPGEDPIGKGVAPSGGPAPYYRVVGVVGDVYASSVEEAPAVAIYYPIVPIPDSRRWWPGSMNLVVHTPLADPSAIFPAVRRAVAEVDPEIPLANVEEMEVLVERSMGRLSFTVVLLSIAATVSLLLAAIGLYGVISYLVARRTSEIGIRIALGARPGQVQRLVIRGSLWPTAAGLLVGLLSALLFTQAIQGMLYQVRPTHAAVYLGAMAVLTAVAVLASWIPARRASRVDPTVALQSK